MTTILSLSQTLCTTAFRDLLKEHQGSILLWGGEVCASRDAHIASTVLQAATFPFLAFLSIQPVPPSRITGSNSTSSNNMSVFSRLEGLQSTSVPALRAHIDDTLLPRLAPFLNRLKAQKRDRDMQRLLMQDQDRAYAEAGKRDLERVRAKEAELKVARDAEERRKTELSAKLREGQNREAWRKTIAANFGREPNEGTRFVIRLPDGKRLVRRFASHELVQMVWYLVDCEANGVSIPSSPSPSASSLSVSPDPGYQPHLSFSLATTFPRRVLQLEKVASKTVGQLIDEGVLDKQAANLIVEGLPASAAAGGGNSDEEEEDD